MISSASSHHRFSMSGYPRPVQPSRASVTARAAPWLPLTGSLRVRVTGVRFRGARRDD